MIRTEPPLSGTLAQHSGLCKWLHQHPEHSDEYTRTLVSAAVKLKTTTWKTQSNSNSHKASFYTYIEFYDEMVYNEYTSRYKNITYKSISNN